ncbi:MAG: hypothetical protein ABF780_03890 [Bifidobacterium aquikefiri]|uniref:ABC transporter permease n=1 Tax=Bifidobacterium aquikefiri TaxID=1653207 RepID=A0A261G104_9BIFI|nr:hypothetical protein [Bifidobacterium aquikefiri]OZG65112.1 ABC transporter permease [Bifidobacterium aquikefiri]
MSISIATSPKTTSHLGTTTILPLVGHTRLTWQGLITSEWIKMRTRVSTYWLGGIGIIMMIAMAVTSAIQSIGGNVSASSVMTMATGGVVGAQFCAMLLGVFAISDEYHTGQIRTTFNAVPKRIPVLAAKATTVAIASFILTFASITVSLIVAHILSGRGLSFGYFTLDILRMYIGAPLYMAFITIISLMVGAVIRKSTGSISVILLILWALPGSAVMLPASIAGIVAAFMPSTVGSALYGSSSGGSDQVFSAITPQSSITLAPWLAFIILIAYAAIFAAIAIQVTKRRDV